MVSKESAALEDVDVEYTSLDADHSTIVKFHCPSDDNYQTVRDKILEIAVASIPRIGLPTVQRNRKLYPPICCFFRFSTPICKKELLWCTNFGAANQPTVLTKERIKLCKWIYPDPIDQKHIEIKGKRQESTGGWLLRDEKFSAWVNNMGCRLLWGSGIRKYHCSVKIE